MEISWTLEDLKRARELRNEGKSEREIARILKIGRRTVRRWLKGNFAELEKFIETLQEKSSSEVTEKDHEPSRAEPLRPRKGNPNFQAGAQIDIEQYPELVELSKIQFKTLADFRVACQHYSSEALAYLVALMRSPKVPAPARMGAARDIIEQGWGKSPQPVEVAGGMKQQHEYNITHSVMSDPEAAKLVDRLLERAAGLDSGMVRLQSERGVMEAVSPPPSSESEDSSDAGRPV